MIQVEAKKRRVYSINASGNLESFDFSGLGHTGGDPKCQAFSQVDTQTLSDQKASSSIDINGDCIPDFILESVQTDSTTGKATHWLEFYSATSTGYCLIQNVQINDNFLMASFADLSNFLLTKTTMVLLT